MKCKIQVIFVTAVFLALAVWAWFKPADDISDSELRKLAQFPEVKAEKIFNGQFMSEFETYALDQFPMRDEFRTVKAVVYLYAFRQLDNNGIYVENGYAAKMEYPLDEEAESYAFGRIQNVYNKFIADSNANCYIAIIPDKNFFLAKEHGALSLDYDRIFNDVKKEASFAQYIDITGLLSIDDYYRTDTHWDQSCITDVAECLAQSMGTELEGTNTVKTIDAPFYGVYYGQAALPMKPDTVNYVTNDAIEAAQVFDWQNSKSIPVYDEAKIYERSPYDLFLGGSLSMITIDNPLATTDKELVVFRDSFGSSLVPLMISGYKKITVLDIRYLPGDRIGSFVEFDNQDVLFLYSTAVLNNGKTLK